MVWLPATRPLTVLLAPPFSENEVLSTPRLKEVLVSPPAALVTVIDPAGGVLVTVQARFWPAARLTVPWLPLMVTGVLPQSMPCRLQPLGSDVSLMVWLPATRPLTVLLAPPFSENEVLSTARLNEVLVSPPAALVTVIDPAGGVLVTVQARFWPAARLTVPWLPLMVTGVLPQLMPCRLQPLGSDVSLMV